MKNKRALIRVCASCERVFIFSDMCPKCGYASYDSVWAIGWKRTIWRLITRRCNKDSKYYQYMKQDGKIKCFRVEEETDI